MPERRGKHPLVYLSPTSSGASHASLRLPTLAAVAADPLVAGHRTSVPRVVRGLVRRTVRDSGRRSVPRGRVPHLGCRRAGAALAQPVRFAIGFDPLSGAPAAASYPGMALLFLDGVWWLLETVVMLGLSWHGLKPVGVSRSYGWAWCGSWFPLPGSRRRFSHS